MSNDHAAIVVFCDGRQKRKIKHAPVPLAIYRRTDGDWLPVHSGTFRDEEIIVSDNGIRSLDGDRPVDGLTFRTRSQYQWRCADCRMNPAVNDDATMLRLLDALADTGAREVSLATIDAMVRRRDTPV